MTQAGANCRIDLWRINYAPDDIVGGAVVTGTLQYRNVHFRFQANPEEQVILQQGLETVRTYQGLAFPGTLDIRERDEVEVVEPFDHMYHGDRFRVIGVRYADHNPRDPRNYLLIQMTRSVRAHNQQ